MPCGLVVILCPVISSVDFFAVVVRFWAGHHGFSIPSASNRYRQLRIGMMQNPSKRAQELTRGQQANQTAGGQSTKG
jgi:hypothetical protein